MRRTVCAVAASVVGAALPGASLAGKSAVSGQQALQVKARLTPARAGARRAVFGFSYVYTSTKPGQQPPYNTQTITLLMPRGLVLDPAAAPACQRSQIDKAKGDVSKCPSKTIIGHGTVEVNVETISAPITGTATIYNAVNNTGEGQLKGTRNLILWVTTSIGVNNAFAFSVMRSADGRVQLQGTFMKPKKPGLRPGRLTIRRIALSTSGSGGRSLITNPPTCHGSWLFVVTLVNYFHQPSITARDRVKCRR